MKKAKELSISIYYESTNGKKRRMKMIGSVEVPQEAFMAVLKID